MTMDLQTFVSATSWIGICVLVILTLFLFASIIYGLAMFVERRAMRRCHNAYKAVSVLYYMGICERHGRIGLRKEAEKARKEVGK